MRTSFFPPWQRSVLLSLFGAQLAAAEVPTASMPLDDDEATVPPPPQLAPATSQSVPSRPIPTASSPQLSPELARPDAPRSLSGPQPTSPPPSATNVPVATTVEIPSIGEPLHASSAGLRAGYARLSLIVREAGATAYVVPRHQEFDPRQPELAILTCTSQCTVELPLGDYTVWVTSAEDARSSVELQLRGSRWVNVSPANQVMRDFGFIAGAVGTLATVLGVAILADAICDTCTPTGRNITGALALGLGLPMGAVGWSLYVIHREARIEERVLSQSSGLPAQLPQGWLLHLNFSF
ncbi:MAG TPA: hypothetical protein VKP30_20285 [Polyangiaceae bacterium]|nr:hypothetical protein [Polyangiaceae bacterium]